MFDYFDLSRAIVEGEAEQAQKLTQLALKEGFPPQKILENGLIHGMNQVAEKFKVERVLVPEVLMSTRAMHAGLAVLKPHLVKPSGKQKCKIVIGTVEGDLHDIGKNLVKILLATIGLEVIDLGVNVTSQNFVNAVRKEKPDILMMSALLTTTMLAMKTVIDELKERGLRGKVRVIVGGAPITESFSREIGADYYFKDAFELKRFLQENLHKILTK